MVAEGGAGEFRAVEVRVRARNPISKTEVLSVLRRERVVATRETAVPA